MTEQANQEQIGTGNSFYLTRNQVINSMQQLQIPMQNQLQNPPILM